MYSFAYVKPRSLKEVSAFLEANPEAADRDQALTFLVNSHFSIGDFEPVPDYLDQRYEAQPKGAAMDLQVVIGEILQPYIEVCAESGQKDRAKAFIARFQEDIAGRPEAEQFRRPLRHAAGHQQPQALRGVPGLRLLP
jgi:hypothetical protein